MPISSTFGPHATALEVVRGVDLSGRVAIVTGGAGGIGVETVRALAAAGAVVTIAARSTPAAEAVAAELSRERQGASVHALHVDLADLASARAAADAFLARDVPLHLLINNAGVMATPFERTKDGFELQFGTNHLGHFALTTALLAGAATGERREGRRALLGGPPPREFVP